MFNLITNSKMKTKPFFRFSAAFAMAISMAWGASAQVITLNLNDSLCWTQAGETGVCCTHCTKPANLIPITTPPGGGYWDQTYNDNDTTICFGEFVFSHLPAGPGASFGGSYWDGFTYVINGDTANYGKGGSSQGWVGHQWGCMAGGGIAGFDSDGNPIVNPKNSYLVAYWGYHMEPEYYCSMHFGDIPPEPMHCLTVSLKDSSLFKPQEVYICNHPWPYYGNIYGDGFAIPMDSINNEFSLWVHAIKADCREDSIKVPLAWFEDGELFQEADWQKINLKPLFGGDNYSIQTLYFTMYATDSDPQWGPNTAVYFCLDKLTVEKIGKGPFCIHEPNPNPCGKKQTITEVRDYLPSTSHTGGEVRVYDAKGKEMLKTTVKAGEKVNLSKLPVGEYRLRHGHKFIPIKKLK